MKFNTLKKVLSIIIISIILAIAITTLVLAFVQKSLYNPLLDASKDMDKYYSVTIYKDGVSNRYNNNETSSEEDKEIVAKLDELMKDSTKASILSLMFQGTSSFEPEVVISDAGNVMTSIASAKGQVCLVYDFLDEEPTLMWNDEAFTNSQAKDPNAPITFRKLFIPISNTEEFGVVTAYLADKDNKSSYQIKFLAHQSEVYEYMVGIEYNHLHESEQE